MSGASSAQLQRLLAEEFERRGWDYDLNVVREAVQQIERTGYVDSAALARNVPADFLERQKATRDDLRDAFERAVGGRTPTADAGGVTTLVINDNRYSLNMGAGAQISGGNVNVGGTQINIETAASKKDVLAGVAALLRAGLAGDWNAEAARELAAVVDARDDVEYDDIEQVTIEVAAEDAEPGRIRGLLKTIAANAIGGAMGTGISAGLGQILSQLPLG